MLPCSPDVPIPFSGDEAINVGLFAKAIFAQPDKTFARTVLVAKEVMSCRDWAAAFERVMRSLGKDDKVVFVECSVSAYEELWGALGTEVGIMFAYFKEFGRRAFEAESGDHPIMTAKDLGIENQLRSTEDKFKEMQWF